MNARDFCFWLQGYMELTGGEYPSNNIWNLILEHLWLANSSNDSSRDEFIEVLSVLVGFTSIAGNEPPTEAQWTRLVDTIQGVFIKVTPDLDDCDTDDKESVEDTIQKILEEVRKTPIIPQPQFPQHIPLPDPWKDGHSPIFPNDNPWIQPTRIICSNGTGDVIPPTTFCTSVSDTLACAAVDDTPSVAGGFIDMFNIGVNIADPRLGSE